MLSFSEIREQMQWTNQALQYIYNNCDENSEFFEMVSDARLLFLQANRGLEDLLQQIEKSQLAQDKS